MSLDRDTLAAAVAAHGRVARVVVAEVAGSAPREAGAAMCVWPDGQSGTIGGGALEYAAAAEARAMLAEGRRRRLVRKPLGPGLGQCCGGAVTLLTELWSRPEVEALPQPGEVFARPAAPEAAAEAPLAVRRRIAAARGGGPPPPAELVEGWMVEPMAAPARPLWIWGAGHVGRALVATLAPLPDFAIAWIDTAAERFPETVPAGIDKLVAATPAELVVYAPAEAAHLVLTYSHAHDLAICDGLLARGFASAGLIGSATKWARFRSRLEARGHAPETIARIRCPIGDPALGKHPQAIAVGVAAELLAAERARARGGRDAVG